MKDNPLETEHHRTFEQIKEVSDEGIEFWSGRDLQPVLEYSSWDKFKLVIEKAITACEQAGQSPDDHFSPVGKMVEIGSGAEREIERGVTPPPKDETTLARWAANLALKAGTPEWDDFMDQADVSRGNIPKDLMSDEKLPVFFRTVRGAELDDEKLDSLIETIRGVHSPDED